MASLFNDINSSDDSDDADYIPEEVVPVHSSDEEPVVNSDDEIESKNSKKRKTKKSFKEIKSTDKLKPLTTGVKKSADDLFKDFLAEVEKETASSHASDSCHDSPSSSLTLDSPQLSETSKPESLPEKNSAKLFDFAGETVSVPNEILNTGVVKPAAKKRGLSAVIDLLEKKPKLSVLSKTKLDWVTYKAENCLEEELTQYNRGRGGFIERKKFLEKCDQKSFEIERDLRIKKRKP